MSGSVEFIVSQSMGSMRELRRDFVETDHIDQRFDPGRAGSGFVLASWRTGWCSEVRDQAGVVLSCQSSAIELREASTQLSRKRIHETGGTQHPRFNAHESQADAWLKGRVKPP